MYKIIIDANVWIKYARAKNISPLLNRLTAYKLIPVVNNYLLAEVFNALMENKWMNEKQAYNIILFIRKVTIAVTEKAVYGLSPDPDDNYLFDLAIQNNCVFIIRDDKELSAFRLKPRPVHFTSWFLKTFSI